MNNFQKRGYLENLLLKLCGPPRRKKSVLALWNPTPLALEELLRNSYKSTYSASLDLYVHIFNIFVTHVDTKLFRRRIRRNIPRSWITNFASKSLLAFFLCSCRYCCGLCLRSSATTYHKAGYFGQLFLGHYKARGRKYTLLSLNYHLNFGPVFPVCDVKLTHTKLPYHQPIYTSQNFRPTDPTREICLPKWTFRGWYCKAIEQ